MICVEDLVHNLALCDVYGHQTMFNGIVNRYTYNRV